MPARLVTMLYLRRHTFSHAKRACLVGRTIETGGGEGGSRKEDEGSIQYPASLLYLTNDLLQLGPRPTDPTLRCVVVSRRIYLRCCVLCAGGRLDLASGVGNQE
jgi:hypothetical protein